jgi:hypothetical protein
LRVVEKALNIFDGMGEFSLPAVIIEQYRTTQSQLPSQAFALYRRNRCKGEAGHPEDNLYWKRQTSLASAA